MEIDSVRVGHRVGASYHKDLACNFCDYDRKWNSGR